MPRIPMTAKTGWSSTTLTTLFQSQGALALDPGTERLLAGLMDIVPELAKPGEPQVLVGDPARAVIDHENETAGQQQQARSVGRSRGSCVTLISHAGRPKCRQPIPGQDEKFNHFSTLSAPATVLGPARRPRKALTLQARPL